MQLFRWPRGPVYFLVITILMVMVPDKWEGPVLYTIDSGHVLSLVDALAMIPLLVSVIWIQRGLWNRRIYLFNKVTLYPGSAVLMIFFMASGLGLFFASAFSGFHYWWAVGGIIFITMLINIVLISGHSPE
jgi:hypothetical protein